MIYPNITLVHNEIFDGEIYDIQWDDGFDLS